MQITRKADYAVRCVLFLSGLNEETACVGEIAKAMHIPRSFLAKILQELMEAEFVESTRGVRGGFKLRKNPSDLTLYDIITAIDGPVAINKCVVDSTSCELSDTCSVHPVWVEIRGGIVERLKKETFANFRKKT